MESMRIVHQAGSKSDTAIGASPVKDKLSKGWMGILAKRYPPSLWLLCATQVYLDIRHIFRNDHARGFGDLWSTATESISAVEDIMVSQINGETSKHWDFLDNKSFIDLVNSTMNWVQ